MQRLYKHEDEEKIEGLACKESLTIIKNINNSIVDRIVYTKI